MGLRSYSVGLVRPPAPFLMELEGRIGRFPFRSKRLVQHGDRIHYVALVLLPALRIQSGVVVSALLHGACDKKFGRDYHQTDTRPRHGTLLTGDALLIRLGPAIIPIRKLRILTTRTKIQSDASEQSTEPAARYRSTGL